MRGLNALRRAINDGDCCVSLDVSPTTDEFDIAGQKPLSTPYITVNKSYSHRSTL